MSPRHSDAGQSLVELALVFSLLLMMVLGVVDFSFVFQSYVRASTAANAGADYAAQGLTEANNTSLIQSAAIAGTGSGGWRCTSGPTVTPVLGTDTFGEPSISVSVTCQVSNLFVLHRVIGGVTVTGRAVRRVNS